jgi:small subunit ribosomal protein S3Ae
MMECMMGEITKNTLKDLFKKLIGDQIHKQITKDCAKIFPLENVLIRKAKVLKKPKFDLTKLMELYQDKPELAKPVELTPDAQNTLQA